jgi:hypothetical protein
VAEEAHQSYFVERLAFCRTFGFWRTFCVLLQCNALRFVAATGVCVKTKLSNKTVVAPAGRLEPP